MKAKFLTVGVIMLFSFLLIINSNSKIAMAEEDPITCFGPACLFVNNNHYRTIKLNGVYYCCGVITFVSRGREETEIINPS